ncbi:MAG: transposase [Planctomycetes bacterium]|nr:transposase [Planctomycetota bacterium]
MPRRPRETTGGIVYHALNRAVGRMKLFEKEEDYAAFERVLEETYERTEMRLLGYCVMPNHWHMLIWPREDGELSEVMRWLTVTHTQRWHAHYHTSGTGPVYQGRFKSFPVQSDEHFITVARYVERNALRAKLVERAQDWRWSSIWRRCQRDKSLSSILSDWPVVRPSDWTRRVNRALTSNELEAVRRSVRRGRPFGDETWTEITAKQLGLEATLRPRGRPRKHKPEHDSIG